MERKTLSVPGKTFFLGEYLALDGGPSIVVTTRPRFTLEVSPGKTVLPFHPDSPAGRYFRRHQADLENTEFKFHDPHSGLGGLGASSAQWALLYASHRASVEDRDFSWGKLLEEYRACAWSGEGVPPSGADVVAQLSGEVTYFDGRNKTAQRLSWSFPSMGFTLLRTGQKLATHEHLKKSTLAPYAVLRTIVLDAEKAFISCDETRVAEAVQGYAHVLREAGLTAPTTTGLLDKMRSEFGDLFWAAKGCGAMGADVVLALHSASRANDVKEWAEGQGLLVCGALSDLSHGLEVQQS